MAAMKPQELIGDNLKLVSLPVIVNKINQLLEDPNSTAADIARFISQDPALSAQLLKVVNSPFYNFPSKVDTISMAVTILGTRQLRDLVIATTMVNHFKTDPDTGFDIEKFWCHSITAGIAARSIAISRKIPNPERLFVSGLLHDIGKMIMSILLPRETLTLMRACDDADNELDGLEQEIFGFTHSDMAEALLTAWQFPDTISQPVSHHHDLDVFDDFKKDTAVVHVANVIANNIQAPISRDDDTLLNEQALIILGLDQTTVESYYTEVYEILDDVLQLLYYDMAA